MALELSAVQLVRVFECWKVTRLGRKWCITEIRVLEGVDCVNSFSPVQLQ